MTSIQLVCPECGKKQLANHDGEPVECRNPECDGFLPCPVCSGDDQPTGWFETDDGDVLACHGCNIEEVEAQRRSV